MNTINISVEYSENTTSILERLKALREVANSYEELSGNQDFLNRLSAAEAEAATVLS